ncbi:CARDB domain-containing protein [[Eubacterium] cellulosolvens]
MWGKRSGKGNLILVGVIIGLLLIAIITTVVNSIFISNDSNVAPREIIPGFDDEPLEPTTEPLSTTGGTRLAEAGELLWAVQLTSNPTDAMLSTPALADLNPPAPGADRSYLEIIVGCTDNHVYAVDKNGKNYWTYSDCIIDDAVSATSNISLDFDPAPFFSSITPVDIAGSKAPELIMGEQNGVLAIAPDGSTHWKDKGKTEGYYFSSIAVTDLEGDFAGIDAEGNFIGYRDDLEIVLGSDDDTNADAYLEAWQANGQCVFRYNVAVGFENAFMTNSIVATELDGYFMGDEQVLETIRKTNPETLYTDFITSTHSSSGRIWKHQTGETWNKYHEASRFGGGHETYATSAVANLTGGPELEVIIGTGSGSMSWLDSAGAVWMYRQDGSDVVNAYTTGPAPSSIFSSAAICDAQNLDEDKLDEGEVIEYEVFFGCDNGKIYSLSGTDLTELWTYQTGGRILSSPAIANINSDERLEVIIGSNDGFVYCFEADPHEFDRDGEPHPKDDGIADTGGEDGIFDILWMFDTRTVATASGEIGISSPVVGDINYDGQLEVLIGDTQGNLFCISAGGNCIPGQVDWPMFHGDINKTGFYNPSSLYGVKVEPQIFQTPAGPRREELKKSVKPGEEVTYNITVTNLAISKTFTDTDTFWISTPQWIYKGGNVVEEHEWPAPQLTGEDLKWSGGVEGVGKPYVTLQTFQQTNITLTVPAPWSGDLGEFTQIKVEANSSKDRWIRDSVLTTTSLEIFLDFDIKILKEPIQDSDSNFFGQKVINVNPSDRASVEVSLKNKGNLNDSYDMRIEGVLFGWEVFFIKSESSLYLDALQLDAPIMKDQFPDVYRGSEDRVSFSILAPAAAQENEILTLKVIATSRYSQNTGLINNISKYDYLIIEVNPVPNLELTCKNPRQYVAPGKNITYEIAVINRGNSEFTVQLEHSQLDMGWTLEYVNELGEPFEEREILLDIIPGNVSIVTVMLHAPHTALAGSRQNIIIRGITVTQDEITLQRMDSVALTAIVSQFFDIDVIVCPSNDFEDEADNEGILHINPGTIISYDITINNTGNGEDFVIIMPTLLEVNWDSTFYLNNEERVTSELDYNTSVTFKMQITIPKNQLAGIYKTGINVTSIGDYEIEYFDTVVNKILNLSLFGVVYTGEPSEKKLVNLIKPEPGVSPGWILDYLFEVTNGGNAPDVIKLDLSSIDEAWGDWKGTFLAITNTEAYMTEVANRDFAERLDMATQTTPVGFLNNNSNPNLHEIELTIGMHQKIWVKIQITVPSDITPLDSNLERRFNIHAESKYPTDILKDVKVNDNDVSVVLKISFPDLCINSPIRHPDQISNGEIVTISADVSNYGDIEAREVLVRFYVDGKEVKTVTIKRLPIGSSRLVPFTWQAADGMHTLTIKVDPENVIVEKNENNNEKSKDVAVESNELAELFRNRVVCSIISIIIFIMVLAIIVKIRKHSSLFVSKPNEVKEKKHLLSKSR